MFCYLFIDLTRTGMKPVALSVCVCVLKEYKEGIDIWQQTYFNRKIFRTERLNDRAKM